MSLKKFKFTLDFVIDIEEIDRDSIRQSYGKEDLADPQGQQWVQADYNRQNNLLKALLADQRVLKEFIKQELIEQLEGCGDRLLREKILDQDTIDQTRLVIDQIVPALEDEDERSTFEEMDKNHLFYENTEQFHNAFKIDLGGYQIEEIPE